MFHTTDKVPLIATSVQITTARAAGTGGIGYFKQRSVELPNPPLAATELHEVSFTTSSFTDQSSVNEGGSFYVESK